MEKKLFLIKKIAVNIDGVGNVTKPKGIICSNSNELVESSQLQTTDLVRELLMLREKSLTFSNNVNFSDTEIEQLIKAACTC